MTLESTVDTTLKILVTLLAQPRVTAAQLAEGLGRCENTVAKHLGRLRALGITIEYDRAEERYNVDLGEGLHTSLLGRYAKTMQSILGTADVSKPVKVVESLERYSVVEFAESIGCTPQNVHNMISGYKGTKLPAGFVAYQMKDHGKWLIQRMVRDEENATWVLPPNITDAYRVAIGDSADAPTPDEQRERMECKEDDCGGRVIAKGRCWKHYRRVRRAEVAALAC